MIVLKLHGTSSKSAMKHLCMLMRKYYSSLLVKFRISANQMKYLQYHNVCSFNAVFTVACMKIAEACRHPVDKTPLTQRFNGQQDFNTSFWDLPASHLHWDSIIDPGTHKN